MFDMKTGEIWKIEYYSDDDEDCGELLTNFWLVLKELKRGSWQMVFLGGTNDDICFTVMTKHDITPSPEQDQWERL
jgi:hypothetical protein